MADSRITVLDIGSQRVSAAIFSQSSQELVLEDFAITSMLGDAATDSSRLSQLKVALTELVDKLPIKGSKVYCSLTGQSVFTRFVKLPPLGQENIDKLVAFEAQQNVPFPMNEVVWDYQLLGELKSGEQEAVLAAIKADALNEITECIEECGLQVELIDIASMATFNAFCYNYAQSGSSDLIIDIGARSTNLIYFDGERLMTRSVPVGGSQITNNIAREFEIPFTQAEELKLRDGFVARGGTYADHEDPRTADLSKLIRNTLGRLHSEVGRTTNYFCSQQGGSAPQRIYICGGSSSLPFLKEFFEEKLQLPVEYLNPLQKVLLKDGLEQAEVEEVAKQAHAMPELVGMALRASGNTPMHLDMVPDIVERRRDLAVRKPSLILAALSLFAVLGASCLFFKKGAEVLEKKTAVAQQKQMLLNKVDKQIKKLDQELKVVEKRSGPLEEAIADRSFWVRLLHDINNRYESDVLWFTVVEPLSGGKSLTASLASQSQSRSVVQDAQGASNATSAGSEVIDSIRIQGLYRDNPQGRQVLYDLVERLKQSPFLELPDLGKNLEQVLTYTGSEETESSRWAYGFTLELPLKRKPSLPAPSVSAVSQRTSIVEKTGRGAS